MLLLSHFKKLFGFLTNHYRKIVNGKYFIGLKNYFGNGSDCDARMPQKTMPA